MKKKHIEAYYNGMVDGLKEEIQRLSNELNRIHSEEIINIPLKDELNFGDFSNDELDKLVGPVDVKEDECFSVDDKDFTDIDLTDTSREELEDLVQSLLNESVSHENFFNRLLEEDGLDIEEAMQKMHCEIANAEDARHRRKGSGKDSGIQ